MTAGAGPAGGTPPAGNAPPANDTPAGAGDQPDNDQPAEDTRPLVTVRPAAPDDVPALVELVRALADYEHALDVVELEAAQLGRSLFGDDPRVFAHVALRDGAVVGLAIWFVNYSTWTGRHGIYLEDLFVAPAARGCGAGRALLSELARVAVTRGYRRVEWAVLDWNEAAAGFYRHLGAVPQDEWTTFRLSGPALSELAHGRNGAIGQ